MPSAEKAEAVRVVIDEASFDFRQLGNDELELQMDIFNETVSSLRNAGIRAWKPPMFEAVPCHDRHELFEFLMSGPGTAIDRDTRYSFFGLVDKCPEWDPSVPGCDEVTLADARPVMAMSVAYALTSAIHDQGVSCLVFGACSRRGFVTTTSEIGSAEIFFFTDTSTLPLFWRALFEVEEVAEADFFNLAYYAFPGLVFSSKLNFRRFDGAYRDIRPHVVTHLSVLNDHFLTTHRAASGIAQQIEGALASLGCAGVSPESPKTHRSEHLMSQRDVAHEGNVVRCEWHTKLEPHRNRIHFAFGGFLNNKILIGIFVDHLDT